MAERPTAIVYVDGFNLYHQKLKFHGAAKWLDLRTLASRLVPSHDVVKVRYFTAPVRALKGMDPQSPIRQQTYLRALRDSGVDVHDNGQFRQDPRRLPTLPIELDANLRPIEIKVRKVEEKGSDVNLASHVVFDAAMNHCDLAVIASNDSDYCTMLDLLTNGMGRPFAILSPVESPAADLLKLGPLFVKPIRKANLLASQFPEIYRRKNGHVLHRPAAWK